MKTSHKLLLVALLLPGLTSACVQMFKPQDKGGVYLIVAVKAEDPALLEQTIAQAMKVIQARCDQLNIYCKLERLSNDKRNQIKLRVSGSIDRERIKYILLSEGMEMRAVVTPPMPSPIQRYHTQEEAAAVAGADQDVMPYLEHDTGSKESPQIFVIVERKPIVQGSEVRRAEAAPAIGGANAYQINFQLNPEGAAHLYSWSSANINHYIAVVLNKQIRSIAYIKSPIYDNGQITGKFTKEQAEDAAFVLRSGSLLAPVEVLEEGTYKP